MSKESRRRLSEATELHQRAKTKFSSARNTGGLVLWLFCSLSLAGFYAWVNLSGVVRFGLCWAIKPGFIVLFFIVVLAVMELRTVAVRRIVQVVLCLLAAIFLEYLSLSRPTDAFAGIALTLSSLSILFNSVRKIPVLEVLLLLVSSNIRAVYVYNLFRGEQMMFFFKPGWTV
jgi:hypothetical protein